MRYVIFCLKQKTFLTHKSQIILSNPANRISMLSFKENGTPLTGGNFQVHFFFFVTNAQFSLFVRKSYSLHIQITLSTILTNIPSTFLLNSLLAIIDWGGHKATVCGTVANMFFWRANNRA